MRSERSAGVTLLAATTGAYLAWSLLPIAYTVVFSFDRADRRRDGKGSAFDGGP